MALQSQVDDDDMMSEINVTPLVDVMLVLLVVFIVTAPLLSNAVHVNLPKTQATAPPDQKKSVSVTIDKDGKVFIERREVGIRTVETELTKLKRLNPDLALQLQADDAINYGVVAKVMASVERAGISKMSVMTALE